MELRQAMKFFFCFVLVPFSLSPCLCQEPPVALTTRMPESSFVQGAPVRLNVIVKNLSKDELRVWKADPQNDGEAEAYIGVEVRDSTGKLLPRIDGRVVVRNGKKYILPKLWMTRKGAFVAAGQELRDFVLLSSLFDLSEPGAYIVSAEMEIPGSAEFEARTAVSGPTLEPNVIESKTIRFVVTPKDSK